MPDMTCLMVPSLPAASIAWNTHSSAQLAFGYSSSCNSDSRCTPCASSASAAGLSIALPPESSGSWSFSRKPLASVTRQRSSARSMSRAFIGGPSSAAPHRRLIASACGAWQVGIISIRLMLTWSGWPTAHATASAMSSGESGVVPW